MIDKSHHPAKAERRLKAGWLAFTGVAGAQRSVTVMHRRFIIILNCAAAAPRDCRSRSKGPGVRTETSCDTVATFPPGSSVVGVGRLVGGCLVFLPPATRSIAAS